MSRDTWPIIIGGCHRSGTSLIRRILNAHSRIYCGPEVKFFRDFYGDFLDDPIWFARFLASARAMLPEGDLLEVLGRAFVALHERAAAYASKSRWAEKNPENVLYLAEWQRLLGDNWLFVHVVRNPLDTLASIKEVKFAGAIPAELSARIAFYQRYTQAGLDFGEAHPDRYYRLLYEQLVHSPSKTLEDLMQWLDEAFEPGQLEFNKFPQQSGLEDPKIASTSEIHTESIGRWQTVLSYEEAQTIWRETRQLWTLIDPDGHYDASLWELNALRDEQNARRCAPFSTAGTSCLTSKDAVGGTVIVEAGSDSADLLRRLESVVHAPDSVHRETVIVCLDSDQGIIEATLPLHVRSLSVVSLTPNDAKDSLVHVLRHVNTSRVAFLPAGGSFSDPRWHELPHDSDFVMARVPTASLPRHSGQVHPAFATGNHTMGWLASTGFLAKVFGLGPPAEWNLLRLAEAARKAGQSVRWLSAPATASPDDAVVTIGARPVLTRNSSVLALIPHYRCEEWLFDCLESLVGQTRSLEGIVVIDDGSRVPPVEIVRQFQRVTLLAAAENVGPFRLTQQVMNDTGYDAYLLQDADDWSAQDRLERQLAEAERTGAELVGCQELRLFCDDGRELPVCFPLDVNAALAEEPTGVPLLHGMSLVSRHLVMRIGGFATALRLEGDVEFLRRAAHVAHIVNLPRYCYFRRKWAGSLTSGPDTGLQSLARAKERQPTHERALQNATTVARGEAPVLEPYARAGPVQLIHILGPKLRPAPRNEG